MKLSDLLSAIGLVPSTIEQAKATREAAAATLTKVNEMFAAAGLNLEQMLDAGPDALKAHLASFDQSAEIASLQVKITDAEGKLVALGEALATEKSGHQVTAEALKTHAELFATVGFKPAAEAKADDVKKAFKAHVEAQAAQILASDGRPPLPALPAAKEPAALSDAEHLAKWQAMAVGSPERMDYAAKHREAIERAIKAETGTTH